MYTEAFYINFSSGAAYLIGFIKPATAATQTDIRINHLSATDYYGISKMNSDSLDPISKFAILEYFSSEYGLIYKFINDVNVTSTTGHKHNYYSINDHAKYLGYEPGYDSLTTIIDEYKYMRLNIN
jgi:hypothetical protein